MSGFRVLLEKEWLETRRTWRIWVIPGLLAFFALVGPILAELTPALVESLANDEPGTIIVLPDPTARDAYRQFFGSLTQVVLIALVIVTADSVAGEKRTGTAILVLTKPVARRSFLLAKVAASGGLLAVATVVAAAVCWSGTRLIFGEAPFLDLVEATAFFVLLGLVLIAAMSLLSVEIRSQAGAAGAGIAVYAVLVIAGQWGPARSWSPAGLFANIDAAITGGAGRDAFWPALAGLAAFTLLLTIAVIRFERVELAGTS